MSLKASTGMGFKYRQYKDRWIFFPTLANEAFYFVYTVMVITMNDATVASTSCLALWRELKRRKQKLPAKIYPLQ